MYGAVIKGVRAAKQCDVAVEGAKLCRHTCPVKSEF